MPDEPFTDIASIRCLQTLALAFGMSEKTPEWSQEELLLYLDQIGSLNRRQVNKIIDAMKMFWQDN